MTPASLTLNNPAAIGLAPPRKSPLPDPPAAEPTRSFRETLAGRESPAAEEQSPRSEAPEKPAAR